MADPGPDLKPGTKDDVAAGSNGLGSASDTYKLPIAGVVVSIVGTSLTAVTNAQGFFSFSSIPSGDVKLEVDGTTATGTPAGYYFPQMVMDLNVLPGVANTVMADMQGTGSGNAQPGAAASAALGVYLPRVATSILQTISPTGMTQIGVDAISAPNLTDQQRQQLSIEVPGGVAVGLNGQKMSNVQVGISVVPPQLVMDMLPPGVMQHTFDITIQAPGVATFTTPVAMTFPNVFDAAPGTKLNFLSFDHTTGRLLIEGTATVSADGLSVHTDPGTGITHPGWHGLTPPGTDAKNKEPPKAPKFDPTKDENGNLYPDGVRRKDNSVKTGNLDPNLRDNLDEIRDAYRDIAGQDKDLVITSGHDGHEDKPNSQHNHDKAIDIRTNGLNDAQRDQLAKELKERLPPGTRIGGSNRDGSKLPHADFPDASNHIHIDTKNVAGGRAQTNISLAQQRSSSAPISNEHLEVTHDFSDNFVEVLESTTGGGVIRTRTNSQGEFESLFLSAGTLYTVRFYDPKGGTIVEQDIWTGPSGGSVNVLSQTNADFSAYYASLAAAATNLDPDDSFANARHQELSSYVPTRDSDGDGLPDEAEEIVGTNPRLFSTSGGGLSDGAKVAAGLDPLSGAGFPTGVIANLPLQGIAKAVEIEGSTNSAGGQTACVATGNYGLAIVNASQFSKPTIVSQLSLPGGDATDVSVDPNLNIAAVADNAGGLVLVDVADPQNPTIIKTITDAIAGHVRVNDGVAYATVGGNLQAYDLQTGDLLQILGLSSSPITALAREGAMLYTTDSANVLRTIDVASVNMILKGTLAMPAGGGALSVANGIAYVGAEGVFQGGFVTADVSDPDHLVLLSGVDNAAIAGRSIVPNGSGLGISIGSPGNFGNLLQVLNVSDPSKTDQFVTQFSLPQDPFNLVLASGIAYVADGTGGLQVINYEAFDNQGVPPIASIDTTGLDTDTSTPGIQVVEGTVLPIKALVSDDVQVRDVALLVNGQVVQDAVSFPFNLSATIPTLAAGSTTLTIQIRATDTGGDVTTTNPITLNLVPDTTPPSIASTLPGDGETQFTDFHNMRVRFSEPMAEATLTVDNFSLTPQGGGAAIHPTSISILGQDRAVNLVFATLPIGTYQFVVDTLALTDRVGNAIGAPNYASTLKIIEQHDPGSTLATALELGTLAEQRILSDSVNFGTDDNDVYSFTLSTAEVVQVGIAGFNDRMHWQLIRDTNSNGNIDNGEIYQSQSFLSSANSANQELLPGTYFVRVQPADTGTSTPYTLTITPGLPVSVLPVDPGSTLATALSLGALTSPISESDLVMAGVDDADIYSFTISTAEVVQVGIAGFNDRMHWQLIRDTNSNGNIDNGEIYQSQSFLSSGNSASQELLPGTYFVHVQPADTGTSTPYTLTITPGLPVSVLPVDPGSTLATALSLGASERFHLGVRPGDGRR